LTQSFFTRVLENGTFAVADRERGRFRTFLLTALNHFLVNEFHHKTALKRGAGQELISIDAARSEARYALEPVDVASPYVLYQRRWAATVLENALARLRIEYNEGEKEHLFECLKGYVWGEDRARTCANLATDLGMSEEGVKKAVQRLRQRYAQLVRLQIAETVTTPADLEDELRHLSQVLRG
jgi:RNA polymerase sigma-70 factor (ECF subfamily)